MHLNLEAPAKFFIRRISAGQVTINDSDYFTSLIICGDAITPWKLKHFNELSDSEIQTLIGLGAQVILIGTGSHAHFLSPTQQQLFYRAGIGVELMPSTAACRTYNILAAEGRNIALALII